MNASIANEKEVSLISISFSPRTLITLFIFHSTKQTFMRNNFLKLSGFLILWLACLDVSAQVRTITGTVKDAKGEALVGVTVLAKGTVTGAYTDEDGNYVLALPQNAATIEFKYLGYKTMDVPVSSSNVVNITLEEDVLGLNEVVVTALGIPKEKKALGYSTQAVSGDDLNKSGSGNTLSELNGKVAGLTVINSSGTPGGGTYLRLRGVTSLTGNNQPLLIVDGIPVDNSINVYDPTNAGFQAGAASGNNTGGVNIDNRGVDINPNDIASITVLKGPAATALYGIEAASGAILITTKKGGGVKKGTNVSFNTSYSIDKVNKLPEMQSTYAQGSNGLYLSPGSASGDKRFSWGPAIDTLYWDALPNLYDMHGNIVGQSDPSAVTKVTPTIRLIFL
jgi:TonB-dependent SusC/RagA subfamily outer membrane receptor